MDGLQIELHASARHSRYPKAAWPTRAAARHVAVFGALLATGALAAAVDAGARMLGPVLIVVAALSAIKAVQLVVAPRRAVVCCGDRAEIERQLHGETQKFRQQVDLLGRKLADPAAHVQPRIADFLYDMVIAFSGRDSGVFVPIGAGAGVSRAGVARELSALRDRGVAGCGGSRVAANPHCRRRRISRCPQRG
jgi:hypothetical protein